MPARASRVIASFAQQPAEGATTGVRRHRAPPLQRRRSNADRLGRVDRHAHGGRFPQWPTGSLASRRTARRRHADDFARLIRTPGATSGAPNRPNIVADRLAPFGSAGLRTDSTSAGSMRRIFAPRRKLRTLRRGRSVGRSSVGISRTPTPSSARRPSPVRPAPDRARRVHSRRSCRPAAGRPCRGRCTGQRARMRIRSRASTANDSAGSQTMWWWALRMNSLAIPAPGTIA